MKRKYMRFRDMSSEGKLFFSLWILSIIFILGISLNFQAVMLNDGKMPVKALGQDTGRHYYYQDNSEVNYYFITDIFKIPLGNKLLMISIGDIIMVSTFLLMAFFQLNYYRKYRK